MTDDELQSLDFRCYVTAAGFNYEATAKALSKTVNIQYIQLDRGMLSADESPVNVTEMVDSYGEQGRFNASVTEDPDNPGGFIVSCNIPADHSIDDQGYVINGAAAVLDNGIIYAYRRVESDYKVVGQGSAKSYIIRLRFLPSNADVISFTIDPSVVLVTQEDLADQKKILIAADANVLQQAKDYADAQDSDLKAYVDSQDTDLKAYVDAQDKSYQTAAKSDATKKANQAQADAKTYADTQDASTLETAKNYADTQDAATLAAAQSDATSKANSALSSAKSYADTQDATVLASAKSDATSKANNVLNSAKSYADTQDATTLASAKSDATTKANSALSSAKSYADTQDATTLASAKSDATSKVNSALSSAKSYADTQDAKILSNAKSYADTQDAAILAAAKSYADSQASNRSRVASGRALSTTYTNSTSNVLFVSVAVSFSATMYGQLMTGVIDGTVVAEVKLSGGLTGETFYQSVFLVVLPGESYSVSASGCTLRAWSEC
ncbi:phage tail protein [Celerinatantimonas sp. MCCC 1A17872]|uniref:phage tail-collar fiber domain-containing protein n=1 Tax=Celerinatantimonas sp. MCCC 1A17872 TaxID=3177514 RepID=UPI0038C2410C